MCASSFPSVSIVRISGIKRAISIDIKAASILALLAAACLLGGPVPTLEAANTRPNFVFILADDLGWRDLGSYGSSFHQTPHIDRLAAEGMRFTQAYTAGAVCSPTRASIMTGRYPPRTGITDYIPGLKAEGRKLLQLSPALQLSLVEVTIAEALRAAGYQTFYAGKWHLGGQGFEPSEQGFDHYVGDAELGDFRKDWQVGRRIAEAAICFLDRRDPARPFLIFLGFHEPHTPILEYPDHIGHYRNKVLRYGAGQADKVREHDGLTRSRQDDPAYGSEIAGLDDCIGMVDAALNNRGLAGTTVVIFFSDNGGLATTGTGGPTCNAPLRAGKGWLYEGGIRVPLIVRVPGVTKAKSSCDIPVISMDFYPTLLELAGLPLRPGQHLDGVSFASLLRGGPATARRPFFWHYPHYHGSTWAPGAAARVGRWKLIEFYHYETVELFDLQSDPGETRDLSASEPARTRELLEQLHAWQKSVNAQVPGPNPGIDRGPAAPR